LMSLAMEQAVKPNANYALLLEMFPYKF
jgi:hypothetical protein